MSQMYSIDQYRFNPMNPMLLRAGSANSLSNKRHKRMAWQASVASYDAKFDRCRLWQKLSLEKTLHQYAAMLVWNTARRKEACEQVQRYMNADFEAARPEQWQLQLTGLHWQVTKPQQNIWLRSWSICETWGHTMLYTPYMQRSCCIAASKVHSIKSFVSDVSSQILR